MAIIKLGVTVVGIRGTIGGMTFSVNKSGPYARAWSKGSNPRTTAQTAERSTLGSIPALWRDLTPGQKAFWNAFAALPAQERTNPLGETFFASGYNWFTIINTRLINMSRAPRISIPTQSRPSAPTISSLVLPFLPQQATKITYPSAEFDPDFDQVIDIGVVISTGRTVSVRNFLQLKLDQNPPDSDNEFVTPYIDRWNLNGTQVKGFAEVFRQTTDGLRSSAGVASFISTGTPAYAATAKDYNGTTNFALRGADLTSNADSKTALLSIWFRIDAGDGTLRYFTRNSGFNYWFRLKTTNVFRITLRTAGFSTLLDAETTTTFLSGATWHNVIWSVNLATSTVQLAVDGVAETPTLTTGPIDGTIDWTAADHTIGANFGGSDFYDGCLTEYYLNNAEFLDITDPANLARFVDAAGFPVDLGATGAFPTGAQPIIYVRDGDPATNRGYGGNFVNQAALSACSTDPP